MNDTHNKATQRLSSIAVHMSPSAPASAPTLTSPAKVAIITGANSPHGIGLSTARRLVSSRAYGALYLCDVAGEHLPSHVAELGGTSARVEAEAKVEVHTRVFDAADEEAIKEVVAHALGRYGRLDFFFANAGTTGRVGTFSDLTADEFMGCMRVNALSVFLAIKHAAPAMQHVSPTKPSPHGSIVATASVAGLRSNAGPPPYSASKAAAINLAQTAAYQLAGTGVRVNAVCPGLIRTGMTEPVWDMARARGTEGRIGQLNPTQRAGSPEEVAGVVEFLASEASAYVNGQAWAVDGGLSAGLPFVPGKMH